MISCKNKLLALKIFDGLGHERDLVAEADNT